MFFFCFCFYTWHSVHGASQVWYCYWRCARWQKQSLSSLISSRRWSNPYFRVYLVASTSLSSSTSSLSSVLFHITSVLTLFFYVYCSFVLTNLHYVSYGNLQRENQRTSPFLIKFGNTKINISHAILDILLTWWPSCNESKSQSFNRWVSDACPFGFVVLSLFFSFFFPNALGASLQIHFDSFWLLLLLLFTAKENNKKHSWGKLSEAKMHEQNSVTLTRHNVIKIHLTALTHIYRAWSAIVSIMCVRWHCLSTHTPKLSSGISQTSKTSENEHERKRSDWTQRAASKTSTHTKKPTNNNNNTFDGFSL